MYVIIVSQRLGIQFPFRESYFQYTQKFFIQLRATFHLYMYLLIHGWQKSFEANVFCLRALRLEISRFTSWLRLSIF